MIPGLDDDEWIGARDALTKRFRLAVMFVAWGFGLVLAVILFCVLTGIGSGR